MRMSVLNIMVFSPDQIMDTVTSICFSFCRGRTDRLSGVRLRTTVCSRKRNKIFEPKKERPFDKKPGSSLIFKLWRFGTDARSNGQVSTHPELGPFRSSSCWWVSKCRRNGGRCFRSR